MRRFLAICILLLIPLSMIPAQAAQTTEQGDALHDQGKYAEAKQLLLDSLAGAASGKEKAELYWRAARETLELGDQAEDAKQPAAAILKIFEEGEGFANKAIEADPQNDLGYYWKSSNIGRWGQTKGILNSLFKAGSMKDLLVKVVGLNKDRSDAYHVLGQLYRELPGRPLSFGNIDEAVSLGRAAVDLRIALVQAGQEKAVNYNYYTELAKSLYKRNWPAKTRASEKDKKASKYAAAKDPLAKAMAYEATSPLEGGSDREEAKSLVQWAISELESLAAPTAADRKDLDKARKVLAGWTSS
jgi:tetratricopeptide (TPR) repeat protein